jgi:peptidoglycan/LPS O-acetylase OafA/YrhL
MRIHGFDFLRGICALMVAVYHMLAWSDTAHLYSWGLFAVYIFFVLSGASMVVAYTERFDAGLSASRFLWHRVVRLAPLFLLVLPFSLWERPEPLQALLDASLLFGLGNASGSIVTGGWSIGIEFAFYLMFPVLLSLARTRWAYWIGGVLAVLQLVFVHQALSGATLEQAWGTYTNPLAFIAYFYAGCLIGLQLSQRAPVGSWLVFALLLGAIAAGSGPDRAATLTGARGVLLFAAVIAVTYFAAGLKVREMIAKPLGDASYGVYLMHPIVFGLLKKFGMSGAGLFATTIAVSFVAALASYWLWETIVQDRVLRGKSLRQCLQERRQKAAALLAKMRPALGTPTAP